MYCTSHAERPDGIGGSASGAEKVLEADSEAAAASAAADTDQRRLAAGPGPL